MKNNRPSVPEATSPWGESILPGRAFTPAVVPRLPTSAGPAQPAPAAMAPVAASGYPAVAPGYPGAPGSPAGASFDPNYAAPGQFGGPQLSPQQFAPPQQFGAQAQLAPLPHSGSGGRGHRERAGTSRTTVLLVVAVVLALAGGGYYEAPKLLASKKAPTAARVTHHVSTPRAVVPSAAVPSAAPSSAAVSSAPAVVDPPATPRLTAIALQPADLPAGWVGTAYVPDPNSDAQDAAFLSCVGGRDTSNDETGDYNSPDYSLGNASISSGATSYRSQADVANDTAIIASPKMSGCYQKLAAAQVTASLPAGATLDSVSIVVTPGAGGGPSNVIGTAAGKITVTISGKVSVVYVKDAFIVGPLTEAEVGFINVGAPLPTTITRPLIAKVAARAAAVAAA